MPETKADPSLPNPKTHGDGGKERATTESKPASYPTSQRHDTETAHHSQDEERPGKPVGEKRQRKR